MLQGLLWLFDDPFSDLLLAGILILAGLHHLLAGTTLALTQTRISESLNEVRPFTGPAALSLSGSKN
jgi:hypothetical protein